MPHISLAFPFLPDKSFDKVVTELQSQLKDIQAFDVAVDRDTVCAFDHDKMWKAIVRPSAEAESKLRHIQQLV